MNPALHILILTSIAVAIFALVMAYGWVSQVDRRLQSLETTDSEEAEPSK